MKTITFYSFKGGTAKSSSVLNIGACLEKYQRKKLLLIDFRRPSLCDLEKFSHYGYITALSGKRNDGQNWNPFWRARYRVSRPESRFGLVFSGEKTSPPTSILRRKPSSWLAFWAKKNPALQGFVLARTGIEPATQGFSVLCSTD